MILSLEVGYQERTQIYTVSLLLTITHYYFAFFIIHLVYFYEYGQC